MRHAPFCWTIAIAALGVSAVAADVTPHPGCTQQDPAVYKKELARAATRWSLDLNLLKGLIQTESRFDAGATSRTGAAGLGQFTTIACKEIQRLVKMPKYAKAFDGEAPLIAALQGFAKESAYNPPIAIEATALLLHHLLATYSNNVEAALTAYNAGTKMAQLVVQHGHAKAKADGLLTFSQAATYAPHVLEWSKKFESGWNPKGKN